MAERKPRHRGQQRAARARMKLTGESYQTALRAVRAAWGPAAEGQEQPSWKQEALLCECRHAPEEHAGRTGRCASTDSYGCPCACPSYVEMDDGDDIEGDGRG